MEKIIGYRVSLCGCGSVGKIFKKLSEVYSFCDTFEIIPFKIMGMVNGVYGYVFRIDKFDKGKRSWVARYYGGSEYKMKVAGWPGGRGEGEGEASCVITP